MKFLRMVVAQSPEDLNSAGRLSSDFSVQRAQARGVLGAMAMWGAVAVDRAIEQLGS